MPLRSITRLQRQFEATANEIASLENSKSGSAMIVSMTVGIIGTAFLAGGVFAFIYAGMIPLMVLLAVPGFAGWALPYFLYNKAVERRTAKVTPIIDQKYDEISDVCEKANGLLN